MCLERVVPMVDITRDFAPWLSMSKGMGGGRQGPYKSISPNRRLIQVAWRAASEAAVYSASLERRSVSSISS